MKIIITEKQLKKITNIHEQEVGENIFGDAYQGLKGVWRGHGYDFYKYTNQVGNVSNSIERHVKRVDKMVNKLVNLENKINLSKMPNNYKNELKNEINTMVSEYEKFLLSLNNLQDWSKQTLK
jgi:hypothetical protein